MKKEKTAQGSVDTARGLDWPAPFQKQNRVQKQTARGSVSELDAKSVFCFFHSAWEVSQRPSRFSPFSSLHCWFSLRKPVRANGRTGLKEVGLKEVGLKEVGLKELRSKKGSFEKSFRLKEPPSAYLDQVCCEPLDNLQAPTDKACHEP
ncbi:hypothetical protein [Brevibacillus borstelensis]|nr:hypothetical protein [Brevibacillus borstelensis]MCC0566509.1 hypothetical protein [Brevibacillus borstelensis]MCM3470930.1 hypothetical protein [Brevibacillus borstelensis]MCM3561417.1 hypothetical protein [Brevibacillus borstelensis]